MRRDETGSLGPILLSRRRASVVLRPLQRLPGYQLADHPRVGDNNEWLLLCSSTLLFLLRMAKASAFIGFTTPSGCFPAAGRPSSSFRASSPVLVKLCSVPAGTWKHIAVRCECVSCPDSLSPTLTKNRSWSTPSWTSCPHNMSSPGRILIKTTWECSFVNRTLRELLFSKKPTAAGHSCIV